MCGRYHLRAKREDILKHFDLIESFDIHGPVNRSEIFPGTAIYSIDSDRHVRERHWTIVEPDNYGKTQRVINARSETVTKVKMFRDYFDANRCLIPATGFFEWDTAKGRHDFTFDDEIIAFGGIARPSVIKNIEADCAVIMTVKGNDVIRPIHIKDRMPLIIRRQDYASWLDPETDFVDLRRMMQPYPAEETHEAPAPSIIPQDEEEPINSL